MADLVGGSRVDISIPEVANSDLITALQEIGPERARTLLGRFREIEASITSLERMFDAGTLPTTRLGGTFRRAAARLGALVQAGDSAAGSANALAANEKAGESYGAEDTRPGLRSREDARRAIQDVVRFIEKIEPGHPAPLLLKRADRLLGMGFCDIIKDMAPNAMPDIERIAGPEQSG